MISYHLFEICNRMNYIWYLQQAPSFYLMVFYVCHRTEVSALHTLLCYRRLVCGPTLRQNEDDVYVKIFECYIGYVVKMSEEIFRN